MSESVQAYLEVDNSKFLIESSALAEAKTQQQWLDAQNFTSMEHTDSVVRGIVRELDKIASNDSLLGQIATISSTNLFIPQLTTNMTDGTTSIDSVEIVYEPDILFDLPSCTGKFFGFNAIVPAQMTEDENGKRIFFDIKPKLQYQIGIQETLAPPSFFGTLCAHSSVDLTTVEFMSDIQRVDANSAISTLNHIESQNNQTFLHNLNALLPINEINIQNIRCAAKMIRLYLDNNYDDITNNYKDAILDFVKARLGIYPEREFIVNAMSALAAREPDGTAKIMKEFEAEQAIEAVTFAPYYYYSTVAGKKQLHVETINNAVSVAVTQNDISTGNPIVLHVPLEKIAVLKPSEF